MGFTGFLALCGRSSPGTFIRTVAIFSVADLSVTAAGLYSRRELNRGVFKMENIKPKPGKLWERTNYTSPEDRTMIGGAIGMLMALNPRALPGAYGVSRFIGAATLGCAFGSKIGQLVFVRVSEPLLTLLHANDSVLRMQAYEKLQHDSEARDSLSMAGKLALKYYTSPSLGFLRYQLALIRGTGDIFDEPQQTKSSTQSPHGHESRSSLQAEANKYTVVQVEFKQSELAGPDIEAGYRAYKDSLDSRDEGSIRDWLERLQDLKKRVGIEIQFVWKHLAQREHEFYLHVKEDWVKDATRRELQLLNNMAADLVTRYAILEYHEKDAQKRLEQMKQTDPLSPAPITAYETPQHPTVVAQDDYKGLQIVTEQVRTNFSRQKELLAHLQQNNYYFMASHPDEGTPRSEHSKQLQRNSSDMYKNVVATGRLLEWLEEQEREADEQVKR